MMQIRKHLFSTLLILLFLSACGGGGSDSGAENNGAEDNADAEGVIQNVIAISDSFGTGFDIATPWPPRLANLIAREVDNTSVSGEETTFGLSNIQALIEQNDPSHVFILLGTNDAIRGSVPNAIANLQAMVDIAQQNGVIAVVGTLAPITRSATEDQRAAEISAGIQNLSGARIAPVRASLGNGETIVDGVHPNDAGQQIIAEAFASQF